MNREGPRHPTYRRRRPGEPRRIFLSEFREGLVESKEEEILEEEEEGQPEFVSEEMGDRNDPLGGSKLGFFGGSRGEPNRETSGNDSTINILNELARGRQQLVDLMT